MASSLVLVDDSLVNHPIDDWHRLFVSSDGGIFIAGIAGFHYSLDLGTHERAQAHVVFARFFRLAGAFAGRFNVCHWLLPCPALEKARIIRGRTGIVNGTGLLRRDPMDPVVVRWFASFRPQ